MCCGDPVNLTVNEVVGRSGGEGGDEEVKGRLEETRGSREEVGILYPCLGETTSRRSGVNFVPPLPLPPPLLLFKLKYTIYTDRYITTRNWDTYGKGTSYSPPLPQTTSKHSQSRLA